MDNYNIKRRDSGKLFSMKRKEYIQRRDSLNKNENKEIPNKKGGVINLSPKDNIKDNNNKKESNDINTNNNMNNNNNFRDDRKVIRRRRTIHEPKMMEIIEEEKIENEEPFDREFKIESSKKKPNIQPQIPKDKNISNFSKYTNNNNNNINNNNINNNSDKT